MIFRDSNEEMTPQEQHGIQLRMTTDVLEGMTGLLANDAEFFVFAAEDLLADIIATNKMLQRR